MIIITIRGRKMHSQAEIDHEMRLLSDRCVMIRRKAALARGRMDRRERGHLTPSLEGEPPFDPARDIPAMERTETADDLPGDSVTREGRTRNDSAFMVHRPGGASVPPVNFPVQ